MLNNRIANKTYILPFILLCLILTTSCSKRNLTYFNDISQDNNYLIKEGLYMQPEIVVGDLLDIKVTLELSGSIYTLDFPVPNAL